MPVVETAGLVVSVIALASLFNSCIELLEFFELGKNYKYDYDIACTKFSLLHERLSDWGRSAHIHEPGHEHPSLREPVKSDLVARSLHKLIHILSDTEGLRKRYDLSPARRTSFGTKTNAHWSLHLRRRTTWSIRDRAKFDRFINDISFLIEHLERITAARGKGDMIPQTKDSTNEEEAQDERKTNQDEPKPQATRSKPSNGHRTAGKRSSEIAPGRSHNGNDYDNVAEGLTQNNKEGQFPGLGIADPPRGTNVVRNSEQNNERTYGAFLGIMGAEATVQTRKRDKEGNSEIPKN